MIRIISFNKYEDLFGENKHAFISDLGKFIGLPIDETQLPDEFIKLNVGKRQVANTWESWDRETINQVEHICSHPMREYNYKTFKQLYFE